MNTKKLFKKLTAVATGATMMGATMAGALAADLNDYPDMFVSEGTFDGLIVLGENAATVDNLAAIDISNSMEYMMAGETSTTTVEGDSWLAATSSNFLEIGENISDIESELDSEHLSALADGEIKNSKGTADYEQTLTIEAGEGGESIIVEFQEADNDNVGFSYLIENDELFATYELEFQDSLESDIEDGVLEDIEDEEITMMGVTYTITTATIDTDGEVTLTLMGGSAADTINEGETKTYTVNGVDYDVTLDSISGTSGDEDARFTINGESTTGVADGETEILEDGTSIGVTDITYQDYAGGIHSATFFLGADKYVLDGSDNSVEHNEDSITGLSVDIDQTNVTETDSTIDSITIEMEAQDDYYVEEGQLLSENADLDDSELLWTENWDINFASVDYEMNEVFALGWAEGNEQAVLTMELESGTVDFELVHADGADGLEGGDDDEELLVWNTSDTITVDDYFFLSTLATTDEEAETFLLQYRTADDTEDDTPKATLRNVVTGEDYERSASDGTFDLKLGGVTYEFSNTSADESDGDDDWDITLTSSNQFVFDSDALVNGTDTLSFRTKHGHLVEIVDSNNSNDASGWNVELSVDDDDLFDDSGDSDLIVFSAEIVDSATDEELTVQDGNALDGDSVDDEDDDDVEYTRSAYGELLTVTASDDDPDTWSVELPASQAEVMLYVTSGSTTTSTTTDGTLTKVSVVDATKLDSEVADVSAQNLLVVGGPCVNSVAAELLASGADCAAGFQAGVARVKLFENGDSVAMLVAGYSGEDTRLAGKVIAHRASELSGDEVEIEGTTYSDATISAPSEEVVEEAAEEEEEAEEEAVAEE